MYDCYDLSFYLYGMYGFTTHLSYFSSVNLNAICYLVQSYAKKPKAGTFVKIIRNK